MRGQGGSRGSTPTARGKLAHRGLLGIRERTQEEGLNSREGECNGGEDLTYREVEYHTKWEDKQDSEERQCWRDVSKDSSKAGESK